MGHAQSLWSFHLQIGIAEFHQFKRAIHAHSTLSWKIEVGYDIAVGVKIYGVRTRAILDVHLSVIHGLGLVSLHVELFNYSIVIENSRKRHVFSIRSTVDTNESL